MIYRSKNLIAANYLSIKYDFRLVKCAYSKPTSKCDVLYIEHLLAKFKEFHIICFRWHQQYEEQNWWCQGRNHGQIDLISIELFWLLFFCLLENSKHKRWRRTLRVRFIVNRIPIQEVSNDLIISMRCGVTGTCISKFLEYGRCRKCFNVENTFVFAIVFRVPVFNLSINITNVAPA